MARRRRIKKNTAVKILIAVVVIVLIIAIALGIFYAVNPEKFNELKDKLFPAHPNSPGGEDGPAVQPTLVGTLEMTVIDIGQGDCIFLQFPDGQTMVMDAGTSKGGSYASIEEYLQLRGVDYLDYVFITHTDQDHIRYMPDIFENYEVHNIYMPRITDEMITTQTWKEVLTAIDNEEYTDENGETVKSNIYYNVGDYKIEGTNWVMNCHSFLEEDYPGIDANWTNGHVKNGVSPICFLEYADRVIVLTGDSNDVNEPVLLERGVLDVDADVLKVAHHGAESSTCQEFLDAVDCEYAIISYGEGNSYKHPHSELMSRLQNYADPTPDGDYNGYKYIYETAKDGNVSVYVDGNGALRIDCELTDDKDFTLNWGEAAEASAVEWLLPVRRFEVQLAA